MQDANDQHFIFGPSLSVSGTTWQKNVDCDIYAIDTTNAVTLARDDLQEILNGGGGGGGSVAKTNGTILHWKVIWSGIYQAIVDPWHVYCRLVGGSHILQAKNKAVIRMCGCDAQSNDQSVMYQWKYGFRVDKFSNRLSGNEN